MTRRSVAVAVLLSAPAVAAAGDETAGGELREQSYLFVGPAMFAGQGLGLLELGGGADGLVHGGLALGVSLSYVGSPECLSCEGLLLGSVNLSYHFFSGSPRQKLVPFAIGGFGAGFDGEVAVELVNFGLGVNLRIGGGRALRFEIRSHTNAGFDGYLVSLRAGFGF